MMTGLPSPQPTPARSTRVRLSGRNSSTLPNSTSSTRAASPTAVSLLVILAFHRVKLPPLPGFIVAGVLLGPNALGLVSDVHRVEGLAEVGVVLLLFTIGIEFSLGRLREMGRQVLVGGGLQVGLTIVAAAALAAALGHPWRVR